MTEVVQDQSEETLGEISTQRHQLEFHADKLEYRLNAKTSAERGSREDSQTREQRKTYHKFS